MSAPRYVFDHLAAKKHPPVAAVCDDDEYDETWLQAQADIGDDWYEQERESPDRTDGKWDA